MVRRLLSLFARQPIATLRSVPWWIYSRRRSWFRRRSDPLDTHRRYVSLGRRLVPSRFTDADPFTLFRIDPERVGQLHRSTPTRRWGAVVDGDWDLDAPPFEKSDVYRDVVAHFRHGIPWSKTVRFLRKCRRIERGGDSKGCTSVRELRERYKAIDDMYESLRAGEYLTQGELRRKDPDRYARLFYKDTAIHPLLDEVVVDIGRDGRLIHRHHGRHRLSIARLIGLDSIPMLVNVRHREWQAVRDRVRAASTTGELSDDDEAHLDHPDLWDVRPEAPRPRRGPDGYPRRLGP